MVDKTKLSILIYSETYTNLRKIMKNTFIILTFAFILVAGKQICEGCSFSTDCVIVVVCLKGWLSPQYGFSDSLLQRIHSRNSTAWFSKFYCSNQLLQAWINPKWQQIETRKSLLCNRCDQTLHFLSAAIPTLMADKNVREYSGMKIWGNILAWKYEGVFQHENIRGYSSMKMNQITQHTAS